MRIFLFSFYHKFAQKSHWDKKKVDEFNKKRFKQIKDFRTNTIKRQNMKVRKLNFHACQREVFCIIP